MCDPDVNRCVILFADAWVDDADGELHQQQGAAPHEDWRIAGETQHAADVVIDEYTDANLKPATDSVQSFSQDELVILR